jgi:DNA-binding XRE family transcriptional regulator
MNDRRSRADRRLVPRDTPERRELDAAIRRHMASRIAEARTRQGWTLQQTADLAGVHYATVVDAEQGRGQARFTTIVLLATALGIPFEALTKPAA